MNRFTQITLQSATALALLHASNAQELNLAKLPKYQTPLPYAHLRNAKVTQNLGPTGARGWIYGHVKDTTDSREILIKSVEPGSPAERVLQPYDVITGAAVPSDTPPAQWKTSPELKRFDSDARISFARAITWAETEAAGGKLRLLRSRDGKTSEVVIQLPVLGSYSATSPFDCPKSQRIVDNAANFLADNMPVDGYGPGIGRPLNAGLLLASGHDAFLDHVRRSACRMSINHTVSDAGHETWRWGNTNTFLCEYYLATGDQRVLPTIREYCKVLADGQCNPGTWGHRSVPDFVPPGYGSLNSSGVVCFLSLVLGKQCGVDYADTALRRSIQFYGSYAGRGSVPYGDHPPSYASTSNGKNGVAAVAFDLLGAGPASQWFGRLCNSSNLAQLEGGHSGNYFNQTWSPLGSAIADRDNHIKFWTRLQSYRDLARRRDGSFMTQPMPNTREGDLGTGNYVAKGPLWTTGSFALGYLAETRRLAILGRNESVFAANAPAELTPALALYRQKKFSESIKHTVKLQQNGNERIARLAKQLGTAAQRNLNSISLTLADMARTLELGDVYKLKHQLQAIESVVDRGDVRLKPFYAALTAEGIENILANGKSFYEGLATPKWAGGRGFERVISTPRIQNLATLSRKGLEPYKSAASALMEKQSQIPPVREASLIPRKAEGKKTPAEPAWRMMPVDGNPPASWHMASFDDSKWAATSLPSKTIKARKTYCLRGAFDLDDPGSVDTLIVSYIGAIKFKAYLNGELVLDIDPAGGTASKWSSVIQLKPATRELLRKRQNTLAVVTTASSSMNIELTALVRE